MEVYTPVACPRARSRPDASPNASLRVRIGPADQPVRGLTHGASPRKVKPAAERLGSARLPWRYPRRPDGLLAWIVRYLRQRDHRTLIVSGTVVYDALQLADRGK